MCLMVQSWKMEGGMTINPLDLLKNLQKVQAHIGGFQEQLAEITVTGAAGGGMVEVDMSAKMEVLAVRISRDAFMLALTEGEPDIAVLEDLILSASQAAFEKARIAAHGAANDMASDLGIPPGMFSDIPGPP